MTDSLSTVLVMHQTRLGLLDSLRPFAAKHVEYPWKDTGAWVSNQTWGTRLEDSPSDVFKAALLASFPKTGHVELPQLVLIEGRFRYLHGRPRGSSLALRGQRVHCLSIRAWRIGSFSRAPFNDPYSLAGRCVFGTRYTSNSSAI